MARRMPAQALLASAMKQHKLPCKAGESLSATARVRFLDARRCLMAPRISARHVIADAVSIDMMTRFLADIADDAHVEAGDATHYFAAMRMTQ